MATRERPRSPQRSAWASTEPRPAGKRGRGLNATHVGREIRVQPVRPWRDERVLPVGARRVAVIVLVGLVVGRQRRHGRRQARLAWWRSDLVRARAWRHGGDRHGVPDVYLSGNGDGVLGVRGGGGARLLRPRATRSGIWSFRDDRLCSAQVCGNGHSMHVIPSSPPAAHACHFTSPAHHQSKAKPHP
jgi:hypothetical protein